MNRNNVLVIGIIIGFIVGFFGTGQVCLLAEETELQTLCNQLNDFKRYEGKKIGYEETQSPSWEIGEKIVSYEEEAIPYLLDIYQNSDNLIAQLFAARLIGEIDFERGWKLLENFKDNERTIETIFNSSMETMTIGDVTRKELVILQDQRKKTESTQSHRKSKI
ncbi:hypothetical protein ACFL2Y_03895 [Candidatus Omnitrophota bacterium]